MGNVFNSAHIHFNFTIGENNMSKGLLVFNIERINGRTLRAQGRHDRREGGDLSNVDGRRTKANIVLCGSGDPVKDCAAVIGSHAAKLRKDNTAPYDRFVLSYSPGAIKTKPDFVKWARSSMDFLRREYGPGLAYAVLHLDETTPHIHAVCVPLVARPAGWIVSHSAHPSHQGRNSYAALRKRAADATGLAYGEPGNAPQERSRGEAARLLADAQRRAEETERLARASAALLIKEATEKAYGIIDLARSARASLSYENALSSKYPDISATHSRLKQQQR